MLLTYCAGLSVIAAKQKLQHNMLPTNQQYLGRRIKPQTALELSLSVLSPHVLLSVVASQQKRETTGCGLTGLMTLMKH